MAGSGRWLTAANAARMAILAVLVLASGPSAAAATDPLPVTEVAPGDFVYVAPYELANAQNANGIGNCGFIIGERTVAVIDSGGSVRIGQRLLAAIRAVTDKPIAYVVNTHVHPDHLLGNAAFEGMGARFVGNVTLPDALAARARTYLAATRALIGGDAFDGTRIVGPDLLVDDRLELDLGGRRLILEAWPTAHTNSDLTVLDAATSTWFLGDLVFAGHVPALDGSLRGWIEALDKSGSRAATRVVPGHGPASLPWPQAAQPVKRYLTRLRDDVRALIKAGNPMKDAGRAAASERGSWRLFDAFNTRNAVVAYHELEWE